MCTDSLLAASGSLFVLGICWDLGLVFDLGLALDRGVAAMLALSMDEAGDERPESELEFLT